MRTFCASRVLLLEGTIARCAARAKLEGAAFSAITRVTAQSGCADNARIKSTIASWTAASLARAARESGRRSSHADAVPREGKARRKTPFAPSPALTFSSRFFPPVADSSLSRRATGMVWITPGSATELTKRDRLSEYVGRAWIIAAHHRILIPPTREIDVRRFSRDPPTQNETEKEKKNWKLARAPTYKLKNSDECESVWYFYLLSRGLHC